MCNPSGTTSRRALIRCRSNSGNKPSWRNALPHIAEPRRKPSPGKTSSNAFSNDSSPVGRCLGWKFGPRQNSMPLRRRCGTTANVKVLGRNSSLHFAPPLPGSRKGRCHVRPTRGRSVSRVPHRGAAGNRRARLREILGPDWQESGGERTTGERGRSCRSSSHKARPPRGTTNCSQAA